MFNKLGKIGLVVSLLFNILALGILGYKYLQRYPRKDWVVVQSNFLQNYKKAEILLLGDSQVDNFCNVISFKNPVQCIAVPGITTIGLCEVLRGLKGSTAPHRSFILIGINDLRSGKLEEEVLKGYTQIIDTLQHKFPNNQLYILSILPLVESVPINKGVKNERIIAVNQKLKALADQRNGIYIDCFDSISQRGQLSVALSFDGLHLNQQGNQLLYQTISGYF